MRHYRSKHQIEAIWVPHAIGIIITLIDFFAVPVIFSGAWGSVCHDPILIPVYLMFLPLFVVPFWYGYYLYTCFQDSSTPSIPERAYRPNQNRLIGAKTVPPTANQQKPAAKLTRPQSSVVEPMKESSQSKSLAVLPVDEAAVEPIAICDLMCGIPIESYIRFVVSKGHCDRQEMKKQFKMTNAKVDGVVNTLKTLGIFGPGNCLLYPVLLKPEAWKHTSSLMAGTFSNILAPNLSLSLHQRRPQAN